jgi:hypothetical protein
MGNARVYVGEPSPVSSTLMIFTTIKSYALTGILMTYHFIHTSYISRGVASIGLKPSPPFVYAKVGWVGPTV